MSTPLLSIVVGIIVVSSSSLSYLIFVELAEVFNTVNHAILLCRLNLFRVRGIPHQWFSNDLANRKPFVSLKMQILIVQKFHAACPNVPYFREEKIINANNLGAFYRYVNNKLSNNNGIAHLFDNNGNLITSDIDKANLLNDYFKSVFITDDGLLPEFPSRLPPDLSEIHDIHI